jgi:transglutaminase-like putative cysteine protease
MDPTVDTSGYYFTSFTNTLKVVSDFNGGHVSGSYTGKSEYAERRLSAGRPNHYLLRQVYTPNMPEHSWTPIATRPGEMPVRFAGADSALFRQNQMTGSWEVNMTKRRDKNLIVYTAPADEASLSYLKRAPVEAETESLLDMDTLRPDIREAITAIQRSILSTDEKIEEGLAIWRQVYRYDRIADKYSFPQTDPKKYVSAMINQGIGPCGYAALGAVAILREIGIPADAVGGFLNELYGQELDLDELHAWIYVWSETAGSWKYIEPQNGLQTQRYQDEKNGIAYETKPTIAPPPDERRSPDLPVSISQHVIDDPKPAFAGIVRPATDLLHTQWNSNGLTGLNISLEQQIVTYIASEEAKRRRQELVLAVLPLAATAIAPSAVEFIRKVILIKKKIRADVDRELAEEKKKEQ